MSEIPPHNPYSTPSYQQPQQDGFQRKTSNAKIVAPGIVMIILGSLGFILSIISFVMAMGDPPPPDPELPEALQNIMSSQYGATAMIMQAAFMVVNLVIILGGILMVMVKAWPVCLGAAILLIINFGNCICIAGLPVGVWAIVILSLEDVRRSFSSNR